MRHVEIDAPHLRIARIDHPDSASASARSTPGLPPAVSHEAGTPAGMQLERAVKAIFPASTSSLSFFMCSFTHG